MIIVHRDFPAWPLTNLSLLCIQELLLRSCRRPINNRLPLDLGDAVSINFVFTRSTSCTSTSGANSMRLSAVRNRGGKQEHNGPRSIPWTAFLSFRRDKPLEKGLSLAP